MTLWRDMASGGGDNRGGQACRQRSAYDRAGRPRALYLATMGGEEKPAPTSLFKMKSVDWNPLYTCYQNWPAAESGLSHFGCEAAP
jgi:hypothetical protein